MNATIEASYLGAKRVKVTHGRSRALVMTEPPTGREETFSPTDLIPAALGACVLTALAAAAEANDYALTAAEIAVDKRMYNEPRRIGELAVVVHLPNRLTATQRKVLEETGTACPVRHSLHPTIALSFEFHYDLELQTEPQIEPQIAGETPGVPPGLSRSIERKGPTCEAPSPPGNTAGLAISELRDHWERVYTNIPESQVSWHQDEPSLSLDLISELAQPGSRVIDIGGGSSVLAGRLIERRFSCTVLDISEAALNRAKESVGSNADRIQWIASNVTAALELGTVDLWHDRAVFHFLTNSDDRKRYLALAERTVRVGGHLIIAAFALDGPEKCSGLPVEKYDGQKLAAELGPGLALRRELRETHVTPSGSTQRFTYAAFERVPTVSSAIHLDG